MWKGKGLGLGQTLSSPLVRGEYFHIFCTNSDLQQYRISEEQKQDN